MQRQRRRPWPLAAPGGSLLLGGLILQWTLVLLNNGLQMLLHLMLLLLLLEGLPLLMRARLVAVIRCAWLLLHSRR